MMEKVSLRRGLMWSIAERSSVQLLQFLIFIIMARLLTPTDYGLVGMISIFLVIGHLMADGGLSKALIRKTNRTAADCNTVFMINMCIAVSIYVALFIGAPFIAEFYDEPTLPPLIRVLGLVVIIQASMVVHRALLTSKLDFRTQAKSTVIATVLSGLAGVTMALKGYGVWSIVALQLVNQIVMAIVLWSIHHWHPGPTVSVHSFRTLSGLGMKLMSSNIIQYVYQCVLVAGVGKYFSAYALGCFSNARLIGATTSENITSVVQRAAFPAFCRMTDDTELEDALRSYTKWLMFVIAPVCIGFIGIAGPLTLALIGPQWIYTSRLLRILSIVFLIYPLNSANIVFLEIKGMGSLYLRLQLAAVAINLLCVAVLWNYGLSAICCGIAGASVASYLLYSIHTGKYSSNGYIAQLKSIRYIFLNSIISALIMFILTSIFPLSIMSVTLTLLCGILTYGGLTYLFEPHMLRKAFSLLLPIN